MKKVLLLAMLSLVCIMSSCNSSGEISLSGKDDYTFTTTLTVTCSPNIPGYPQTTKSITEIKQITEQEAKETAAKLTTTSTAYSGGYTIKSTMTCVYVLTKNYVAPTGTIVITQD